MQNSKTPVQTLLGALALVALLTFGSIGMATAQMGGEPDGDSQEQPTMEQQDSQSMNQDDDEDADEQPMFGEPADQGDQEDDGEDTDDGGAW